MNQEDQAIKNKYSFIDDIESRKYVIDSLAANRHLSDWEKKFIKSIQSYVKGNGFLSKKQKVYLSNLWEKY